MKALSIWYLPGPYSEEDLEWVRSSNITYAIKNPETFAINDSGWCDMTTGARVITDLHKIFFKVFNEKELMWLKLRYIDRAILYQMYNYMDEHEIARVDETFY